MRRALAIRRARALVLLAACATASCSLDPWGWLRSTDVDRRFTDNQALDAPADITPTLPFSFVVIADTHVQPASGVEDRFAALAAKLAPGDRFVLVCGDLVQNGAASDFTTFKSLAGSLEIPVLTVPGNHDLYNGGWQAYKGVLGTKSMYTFAAGPVRVIALDSANGTLGAPQRKWLEETLAAKTEAYCVTFTHFEFFTDTITETQAWTDYTEAFSLMHLFETSGVTIHFSGHSHRLFERTINGTVYCTVPALANGRFIRVNVASDGISYTVEQM